MVAKIERKIGPEEMLVVIRGLDEEKNVKTDYCLSNATPDTPLAEFARATMQNTGSKSVSNALRAKRAWPSTKCGIGAGGIIISRFA